MARKIIGAKRKPSGFDRFRYGAAEIKDVLYDSVYPTIIGAGGIFLFFAGLYRTVREPDEFSIGATTAGSVIVGNEIRNHLAYKRSLRNISKRYNMTLPESEDMVELHASRDAYQGLLRRKKQSANHLEKDPKAFAETLVYDFVGDDLNKMGVHIDPATAVDVFRNLLSKREDLKSIISSYDGPEVDDELKVVYSIMQSKGQLFAIDCVNKMFSENPNGFENNGIKMA